MKIEYVDYGIANNFGNRIELNRNLCKPKYLKLLKKILKHEMSHSNKVFSKEDLMLDMKDHYGFELIKFMFEHPKSFIQLSPFYPSKGEWHIDINLLITYGFGAIMILIMALLLL